MLAFVHGDAPLGWYGFAFAMLVTLVLVLIFGKLSERALTKRGRKRTRDTKRARKLR